jgi:hypothetical protein
MNDELKKLHEILIAQHQALYDKLDTVTDPAVARTIVTEMQELLHRVDVLQGLLFRETTTRLKRSMSKIGKADTALDKDLQNAKSAADYVKSVSKFLVFVDQAIDLAKTLAPMAI